MSSLKVILVLCSCQFLIELQWLPDQSCFLRIIRKQITESSTKAAISRVFSIKQLAQLLRHGSDHQQQEPETLNHRGMREFASSKRALQSRQAVSQHGQHNR
ncbi:hypothetical protein CEXT_442881 [Caerostris extrusa]|uniref:Secreted protein n=1 Tax=Caerostris extrusa TaxID=172846 RepID=A0AAV4Y2D4_CAEEX|nr:hypothetical protein CEXT_442881 [Caerostris extrusa]